jgi:hypothetical protein
VEHEGMKTSVKSLVGELQIVLHPLLKLQGTERPHDVAHSDFSVFGQDPGKTLSAKKFRLIREQQHDA